MLVFRSQAAAENKVNARALAFFKITYYVSIYAYGCGYLPRKERA